MAKTPGRRSIQREATLTGKGLHTGVECRVDLLPAAPGQGIVFRRTDLAQRPEIRPRLTEVGAVERRTALGSGEATVDTVEHLLAAVTAHAIDDLTIELSGPEPPIADGSCAPYFAALAEAGPAETGGSLPS
jgi:UDP-3-O-acyl-N-acetylglucosamine deacetylase